MSEEMVVIVTGANRGIGLEICKQILQLTHSKPLKLYAASRAGKDLELGTNNKSSQIIYPKLDTTSISSITTLATRIKQSDGKVDVLINNAGINTSPDHSPASVKRTMDTNYRGTLHMCQTFLPLMSPTGRIVNISSVGSSLHIYSSTIQSRFRDPKMTLQGLEEFAEEYEGVAQAGEESRKGFGGKGQGYSFSKACVNAFTGILAREEEGKGKGVRINCCCPGWVDTDMGGLVGQPSKTFFDGAKIPIRLGFGDIGDTTGRYWANPSISDKGEGKVMKW